MILKISRSVIGLFFLRKNSAKKFESPLPIIFNSKFHFGKVWNFIKISLEFSPSAGFIAKKFESPRGADFAMKFHFRKS